MRLFILMILAVCLTTQGRAAEFHPFDGPKPLVVFIQSDPWSSVIGSDTPRVAIYENGQVIYTKRVKNGIAYYTVTLDKAGLERVQEHLKPLTELTTLEPFYDVVGAITDQPEARFYVRQGGRERTTSVYGLRETDPKRTPVSSPPGRSVGTPLPDEVLKLHHWLCTLDFAGSKPWTPKYVEVMLWDFSYAAHAKAWPKQWPGLASPRTIKRRDAFSIFLDGTDLPALERFDTGRSERTAVQIAGKKMALSYRFTFPSEPDWRSAFDRASQMKQKKAPAQK